MLREAGDAAQGYRAGLAALGLELDHPFPSTEGKRKKVLNLEPKCYPVFYEFKKLQRKKNKTEQYRKPLSWLFLGAAPLNLRVITARQEYPDPAGGTLARISVVSRAHIKKTLSCLIDLWAEMNVSGSYKYEDAC